MSEKKTEFKAEEKKGETKATTASKGTDSKEIAARIDTLVNALDKKKNALIEYQDILGVLQIFYGEDAVEDAVTLASSLTAEGPMPAAKLKSFIAQNVEQLGVELLANLEVGVELLGKPSMGPSS